MIITLDGRKLDGSQDRCATLQALIDDVRMRHATRRLIVAVSIDGESLSGDSLDRRLAAPPGEIATLDLESADGCDLAAAALGELSSQVRQAAAAQVELAERLTASQSGAEIRELGGMISLWADCRQAILNSCNVLGADITLLEVDGRSVRGHLDDLAAKLRELRDSLDARDFVLTADLIRYEMSPLCDVWAGLLSQVSRTVQGMGAA